jgi:hypothetical protein
MKGFAKSLAVLLLALAPVVLTSPAPAWGQPGEREARREQRRAPASAIPRGGQPRVQAYAAPVYRGPAPYAGGGARPYPAYPPAPAYAPPPGAYPYPSQPPRRAPNSLGAEWAQQQDLARAGVRQGRMIPLGQVMTGIRRTTPGRLLDAGLEPGPNGQPAYRVRWAAAGGRRIDFIVDAVTGAILARTGY